MRLPAGLSARPSQRPGITAFAVADELVLLSEGGRTAHALNVSAADIWRLCDGQHTSVQMLEALRDRYQGDDVTILAGVADALLRFHSLGLLDLAVPALDGAAAFAAAMSASAGEPAAPPVRFVFGIEDKPYFRWQLAILFESLVGQLPAGWDITVVVCNDHQTLSPALAQLIDVYGVRALTGDNHAFSHKIDFSAHQGGYVALNRVEALRVIGAHVAPDDLVCLMDTDVFLFGDLRADLFPTGNAMAANNIVNDPLFLGGGSEERGVDLQKILSALGCDTDLKRGGVTVFMTGATVRDEKIIRDCFRFAQIVYLMGKAEGLADTTVWMAEMACFALALTANRIDYELLDHPQFAVPEPRQATVPEGSFFHYYADVNDGYGEPFVGSPWNKQLFYERDFLAENLESFRAGARSEAGQRFFDLSIASRRRLLESNVDGRAGAATGA